MCLILSFVILVAWIVGGLFTGNDWISKEGYNANYYLEPDSVGGCNRHSVVGGNELTDQRAGATATRPGKAGQQEAER
jgi:hypothetical protein